MNELSKKIIFYGIIIIVVLITINLIITTISNNINSYSKGLVHWHADVEVMICGEEVELEESHSFLSDKVGTSEMHHHGDMRIHVEGVVNSREDATVGAFFDALNQDFTSTSILEHKNGDVCPGTGKPGQVKMFINDIENFEFRDHEIAHWTDVPPGDKIKIVFE